jgi:hypothetical protein
MMFLLIRIDKDNIHLTIEFAHHLTVAQSYSSIGNTAEYTIFVSKRRLSLDFNGYRALTVDARACDRVEENSFLRSGFQPDE